MKVFNGKDFAKNKEKTLKKRVEKLNKKDVLPTLASILMGEDEKSAKYLSLKKAAADRIGAKVIIVKFSENERKKKILKIVSDLNINRNINGVMVQLPFPKSYSPKDQKDILNSISTEKDVDGMREDSDFLAPVVKAVIRVLQECFDFINPDSKIIVVGSKGFVGSKLVEVLSRVGYKVKGVDIETKDLKRKTQEGDIIISATGSKGLIKKDFIKEGVIAIDVGSPGGDFDKEAYNKSIFSSRVPGGVGPVTIVELLENLIDASEK